MPAWQTLAVPDAELSLLVPWLAATRADALLAELTHAIAWETHVIRIFGRQVPSPRLSCWIGDPGASYVYSGTRFDPHPWPAPLQALRNQVEQVCGGRFNSVLANLYRDGRDSMGWHSDDEPELGLIPLIASVSLGATRRFRLRRRRARGEPVQPRDTHVIVLEHGSLLRMAGTTQRHYRHELPKARAVTGPRLNLTFRQIRFPR